MESREIKGDNYYIEKLECKKGEFTTDDGKNIPFKTYYVYFKREDSPLIMKAKIDKVFNDYVEEDDAAAE